MIVDVHCHVWPDHIAGKALGGNIPDMTYFGDGTVSGLSRVQEAAGIDYSVCLAVANVAHQVERANEFVGGVDRTRFVPFGTIHPGLSPEENLASLRRHDIRGVKVHAVFQGFRLDDSRLLDVMEALAGEYCVIIHVGEGGGSDGAACTPTMVRRILDLFPALEVIACHFGGYHRQSEADAQLLSSRAFLDTSWPPGIAELDPIQVRDRIRRHGTERVLFASDWPTASPSADIEALRRLGLSEAELAAVLGGNAQRLLGLE